MTDWSSSGRVMPQNHLTGVSMSLRTILSFTTLTALLSLGLVACHGGEAECASDDDCPDGQMCHIEDGHTPHCMEMMGDDDDSAM